MTSKQPAISITRRLEFDSGHRIPNHDGQCKHLHGHRYAIEVTLTGEVADHPGKADDGMVLDFGDIKRLTNQYIVDLWDHAFLVAKEDESVVAFLATLPNHKTVVMEHVPTVENLANTATLGGQAVIGAMREGRNNARLGAARMYNTTQVPSNPPVDPIPVILPTT